MSTPNAEPSTTNEAEEYYSDEIELSQYLDVLLAWWREILVIAILTAAIVALTLIAYERVSAPRYSATADVVLARVASQVSLDERVQTLVSDDTGSSASTSRRGALVELVKNSEIAALVIDDLGNAIDPQASPSDILDMIDVEMPTAQDGRTPTDLIKIKATAGSPELASQLANSWAKYYVEKVNALYGQVPEDVLISLESELSDSDAAYQAAQLEYEAFVSSSRAEALQGEIDEQLALRDAILAARNESLTALAEQSLSASRDVFLTLTNAQLDSILQAFTEQVDARSRDLAQLYQDRSATRYQLSLARNLLAQLEEGGDAAANSNVIPLQLLKAQIFSSMRIHTSSFDADGMRDTSQIQIPAELSFVTEPSVETDAEEQKQDIDAIVTMLEKYLQELDVQIETASQRLVSGEGYTLLDEFDLRLQVLPDNSSAASSDLGSNDNSLDLDTAIMQAYGNLFRASPVLEQTQSDISTTGEVSERGLVSEIEQNIQSLRAELEAELSQDQYLMRKRDLARDSLDALSSKMAELKLELSSANSQVRIGALSSPPSTPIQGQSIAKTTGLAFLFGILLGLVVAFLSHYLGYKPFLSRVSPAR